MPEFILDHGSPEGAARFRQCDEFTQGYVEAMFFTDASDADDGDLADATVAELAPETWERIVADCKAFQDSNAALLARAYDIGRAQNHYDEQAAGRDYWYTRNGHGCGFWGRDLGEVGDALSNSARYHTVDLYRGDDGLIYPQ